MILLPAETLGRKLNHTDSLCKKPFFVDGYLGIIIHFYLKESNYIVICKNWLFKLFFFSILQI